MYQHDQYWNHNDELYQWEIHNQKEIEKQIMNPGENDLKQQNIPDATPINFNMSIVRAVSDLNVNEIDDYKNEKNESQESEKQDIMLDGIRCVERAKYCSK